MHSHHHMDRNSLSAYARLRPEVLRARLYDILSLGIPRTARELATLTGADLVSVRALLDERRIEECQIVDGPMIYRLPAKTAMEARK